MVQTTNAAGLDLIKSTERFEENAYKLAGEIYYTIGYGHSYDRSITANTVWTKDQADAALKKDLAKFEAYVTKYAKQFGLKYNDNQFSALVSYCYNRGPGGLMQLLSNSKTVSQVSANIVVYWGSAEKYKNGLVNRRKKEKELFDTPVKNEPVKGSNAKSLAVKSTKPKSTSEYHTVIKGDVVSKIAKNNGVTTDQIKKLNKLDDKCKIQIGQRLRLK